MVNRWVVKLFLQWVIRQFFVVFSQILLVNLKRNFTGKTEIFSLVHRLRILHPSRKLFTRTIKLTPEWLNLFLGICMWSVLHIVCNRLPNCWVTVMKALRNVVQVSLAIWATYILWRATCKLRSGMTSVSYEQKHFDEVLYPSISICPTYSTLGSWEHWQFLPMPPQVDPYIIKY